MKKILALLLTLALLFSLAACGGGGDEKTPSNEDKTPSSSQQQEQNTPDPDEGDGGEEVSGQDYDNVGFTKAQRQVIAGQIGVTTEDEKVVFMYEYEEGDTAVYIDVYDEFNGTTCRYNEWVFCIDKETYDGEYNAYVDDDTDVVSDEKNLYFCMREECDLSWAGSWQDLMDYHDVHWAERTDPALVE